MRARYTDPVTAYSAPSSKPSLTNLTSSQPMIGTASARLKNLSSSGTTIRLYSESLKIFTWSIRTTKTYMHRIYTHSMKILKALGPHVAAPSKGATGGMSVPERSSFSSARNCEYLTRFCLTTGTDSHIFGCSSDQLDSDLVSDCSGETITGSLEDLTTYGTVHT